MVKCADSWLEPQSERIAQNTNRGVWIHCARKTKIQEQGGLLMGSPEYEMADVLRLLRGRQPCQLDDRSRKQSDY